MSFDDEERTERMLFSLPYRATVAEAREVYLKVATSAEFQRWSRLDDYVKCAPSMEGLSSTGWQAQCRDLTTAYVAVVRLAALEIEAMEARRG